MTRIEAYVALFGADCENTAVQDALDALEKAPHPTTDESNELATIPLPGGATVSDVVADFFDNPLALINALPDTSRRKPLLQDLVARMTSGTEKPKPDAAAPSAVPATGTGVPPASGSSAASLVLTSNVARRARPRDDSETGKPESGDTDKANKGKEPEPPRPVQRAPWEGASSSSITPEMRQCLPTEDWRRLRDAAIDARRKNASEALAFLRATARGYKAGQHGFTKKLLGHLLDLLLNDLQADLHESDASEFQRRYVAH